MEAVRRAELKVRTFTVADVAWLITATLLLLGFAFRARGFLFKTIPLWEDEAAWAIRLVELPLKEHVIRPLGFMAVSKLLAAVLAPSEAVLRALPWLAGVASLAMSPFLAKRLFSSLAARLLFIASIALHPGAIDLAKEFKPYSVGLTLHMAFMLLALRYAKARKLSDLSVLLGLMFLGTLFSQDALFAYPSVFGLVFIEALRARRQRHVLFIAVAALATVALLATLYINFWSKAVGHGDGTTDYWGKKYDVFYVQTNGQGPSRLSWTATRIADMAAMPGMRRDNWTTHAISETALAELKDVDRDVWLALSAMGLIALLARPKRRAALLLLGPLVCLIAFNAAGCWPLGAFRTNLFVLLYAAGVAAAAVDHRGALPGGWDIVPTGALVLVPFLTLGKTTHAQKVSSMAGDSAFTDAMRALVTLRQADPGDTPKSELALDAASCAPWRYYTQFNPKKSRAIRVRHFEAQCTKTSKSMLQTLRKGLPTPDSRAFALVSRARSMDELELRLPPDLAIDAQTYVGGHDQLVVRIKKQHP